MRGKRGVVELRDEDDRRATRARPCLAGGLFRARARGEAVANHLTPEELSKELGIDRQEIIRVCIEESIPIYQGKIDKTLFQAHLQASGAGQPTAAR